MFRISTHAAAAIIAAAVVLSTAAVALGQSDAEVPSVGVVPAEAHPDDPNLGQWFILEITQGASGTGTARIVNPAEVPQTIRLYVRDLTFSEDGSPQVNDGEQRDVGLWGAFLNPEITLDPGESVLAEFAIAVPRDAEPGDHVGVVVAETVATNTEEAAENGAQFEVSRRVATRLYVTVPGDATRAFEITEVKTSLDSGVFPSWALVTVRMRNEGRVRLQPTVTIAGVEADGPNPFMSDSVEEWSAIVSVPWYGGPVSIPIEAVDESGLTRRVNATKFVIPWGLLIALALAAAATWRVRHWWRNRGSKQAELRADIARLERLITKQAGEDVDGERTVPAPETPAGDEITVLNAALARARRAGDDAALARGALALHVTTEDALDTVLEALGAHEGKHVAALVDAAASYGAAAVAENRRTAALPEPLRERIGARVLVAATSGGNGAPKTSNGNGAPKAAADLTAVKGLGPAKQEALLAHFGSADAIRAASVDELATVKGIGPKLARDILDTLR